MPADIVSKMHSMPEWLDSVWKIDQDHSIINQCLAQTSSHQTADVIIVGGGVAGLVAAIECASCGKDVVVFEALKFTMGATARSGGQLIPGFKLTLKELCQQYGKEKGKRIADLGGQCASATVHLIQKYGLSCHLQQQGWMSPYTHPRNQKKANKLAQNYRDIGVQVELLDASQTATKLGASYFAGGVYSAEGSHLNPYLYIQSLVLKAKEVGVRLFEQSLVNQIDVSSKKITITVGKYTWHSDYCLICTNGLLQNFLPQYKNTVFHTSSLQIATESLPDSLAKQILPQISAVSTMQRILNYFAKTNDHRLVMGGRGSFHLLKHQENLAYIQLLKKISLQMWPDLKDVHWSYQWGGAIAFTCSLMPIMCRLSDLQGGYPSSVSSKVWILGSYSGRGVALATHLAHEIAQYLCENAECPPILDMPPSFPLPKLRPYLLSCVGHVYRQLDQWHI